MAPSQEDMKRITLVFLAYEAYIKFLNVSTKRRRIWTKDIFEKKERDLHGFFTNTFQVLKAKGGNEFFNLVHMEPQRFNMLYQLLKKKLTRFSHRSPIDPECRLALTLVYLAQNKSQDDLSMEFRIGKTTVREIILETCEAIWEKLSVKYIPTPDEFDWVRISRKFEEKTGLPNCVGVIDGKFVRLNYVRAGKNYYIAKKEQSVMLFATCDSNLCFTTVDVGAPGTPDEWGISERSTVASDILNGNVQLPRDSVLPSSEIAFPYYFIARNTFPLKRSIMRPYPGKVVSSDRFNFNCRIFNSFRIADNSFGVLTSRWKVLTTTFQCDPKNVEKIIRAPIVLHNFLMRNDNKYCPTNFIDHYENEALVPGLWRKEIVPLTSINFPGSFNASRSAFELRDKLKDYLNAFN